MDDDLRLGFAHPSHGIGIQRAGHDWPRPQRPQPILLGRGPGHGHNLVASGDQLGDQLQAQRTRSPATKTFMATPDSSRSRYRDEMAVPPVTFPQDLPELDSETSWRC